MYNKEAAKAWASKPIDPAELTALKAKYDAITDESERQLEICIDLGMIMVSPDPEDPNYDSTYDEEIAPGQDFEGFDWDAWNSEE